MSQHNRENYENSSTNEMHCVPMKATTNFLGVGFGRNLQVSTHDVVLGSLKEYGRNMIPSRKELTSSLLIWNLDVLPREGIYYDRTFYLLYGNLWRSSELVSGKKRDFIDSVIDAPFLAFLSPSHSWFRKILRKLAVIKYLDSAKCPDSI